MVQGSFFSEVQNLINSVGGSKMITVHDFKRGYTPRAIVASLSRGQNRGATVQELNERVFNTIGDCYLDTTRRRVSEMVEERLLVKDGVRRCKVTGNYAFTYRLNR